MSDGGEHPPDSVGSNQQHEEISIDLSHSDDRSSSPTTLVDESDADYSTSTKSKVDRRNAEMPASLTQEFARRAHRKPALTLVGKESKAYQLQLKISKNVSAQYKHLSEIQKELADGLTLEALYDVHDSSVERVKFILDMYNELLELYDNDDNKVAEQTKNMFGQFISQARILRNAIEERLDLLEEEQARMEANLKEEMDRKLEEESSFKKF